MSVPRRMPESMRTSMRSPTPSAIAGRASRVAGTWSSWRPPWFDTITASTPRSAARRAAAAARIPLRASGPFHAWRIQSTSSQHRVPSIGDAGAAGQPAHAVGGGRTGHPHQPVDIAQPHDLWSVLELAELVAEQRRPDGRSPRLALEEGLGEALGLLVSDLGRHGRLVGV